MAVPLLPRVASYFDKRTLDWPLDLVTGKILSLEGSAVPRSFRLIDCKSYTEDHILRVIEWGSVTLAKQLAHYSTISYVWRGIHHAPVENSFAVHGAPDGDRINAAVLHAICAAALHRGAKYVWVDQLCIMQTDTADKNWQIMNMADIYRHSRVCFVVPGGLGRLAEVGEQTPWIGRSWTLQEALLPRDIWCIFRWTRGPGTMDLSVMHGHPFPSHIIDAESAMEELANLHSFSVASAAFTPRTSAAASPAALQIRLFSGADNTAANLMDARAADAEQRSHAIWRAMLMRSARHDVDTVYSAMGLLGVKLDPAKYTTRAEALRALLRAVMARGGTATWLAASVVAQGTILHGLVAIPPGEDDGLLRWHLRGAPRGTVDSEGVFELDAPVAPFAAADYPNEAYRCMLHGGRYGTHAVLLGRIEPHFEAVGGTYVLPNDRLVMLLEPSPGGNGWLKTGMLSLLPEFTVGWDVQRVRLVGSADS